MTNNVSIQEKAAQWLESLDAMTRNLSYYNRSTYKFPAPDKDILREAVKQKPACLGYLQEQPDDDVLLEAVNANGYSLFRIKEPSDTLKIAALKNQRGAIEYIKNPSVEMQVLALTYGLEPGFFDSENLAFFNSKFTDEALASVNPALVTLRQLYADDNADVSALTALYESFQPLRRDTPAVALPESIAPDVSLG